MQTMILRWGTNVLALLSLILLFLIFSQKQLPDFGFLATDSMQSFKTLFISIILEAFPFVLLGVVLSALLQMFVTEQTIRRLIPKNPVLGILFACVAGLIFPLCECGMIPVIRRLMKKGMPVYIAVVFILVGPIINPVVYASTYMAFRSRPEIAYSRMALAFVVAFIIGLIVYRFFKGNPLRSSLASLSGQQQMPAAPQQYDNNAQLPSNGAAYAAGSAAPGPQTLHSHEHGHSYHPAHAHDHSHAHYGGRWGRLFGVLGHASDEFFDMGKYLMFGAMITAFIQTLVPRESLISIGQGQLGSHLFMMAFAFILSLCSTSDAFVASSFSTTFSTGSLLTFLVFGPMLDIKSMLMLLSAFRTRFVLALSAWIIAVVLVGSLLFERLFFTS